MVVTEFMSLDGVVEASGGEEFKYPGWSFEFDRGDDGNQFKLQETMESDALLIGRITYESFAGAWPDREGGFADKFNTMPKYVVSSILENPEWNNTNVITGNAAEEASKLKEGLDGVIQVPGSIRLVQELLEHDLVDEIHLMTSRYSRTGRRLFGETSDSRLEAGRVEDRWPGRRPRSDLRARPVAAPSHPYKRRAGRARRTSSGLRCVGAQRHGAQRRVPRDRVEVRFAMEKLGVRPHRDRSDQAVGEPSNRRTLPAARSVEGRGRFVVGGLFEREEAAAVE